MANALGENEPAPEPTPAPNASSITVVNAAPELQAWVDEFFASGIGMPPPDEVEGHTHGGEVEGHAHTPRYQVLSVDRLWNAIERSVTEGMVLGDSTNTTPWSIARHGLPSIPAGLPHSAGLWHNFLHALGG